jgi:DnaK suppressor protein
MTADPIDEWVESARMRLLQQRAFRLEQLDELGAQGSDGSLDAASREIHVALRVAAAAALADLDAALRRIEQGTYGRCPQCGDSVAMSRLEAVPSAALCGPCHRGRDWLAGCLPTGAAAPSTSSSGSRLAPSHPREVRRRQERLTRPTPRGPRSSTR